MPGLRSRSGRLHLANVSDEGGLLSDVRVSVQRPGVQAGFPISRMGCAAAVAMFDGEPSWFGALAFARLDERRCPHHKPIATIVASYVFHE